MLAFAGSIGAEDLVAMINYARLAETTPPSRPANRTATVYEILLDGIINGGLPGGTIVEERALVEILDVSRTPLREALGRLQGEGFVVRQGRKLVVHQVTERDLIEILHLRRILECEAVALATTKLSQKTINEIRSAFLALRMQGKQQPERHWAADELLHATIAEASGNSMLCETIMNLRRKTKPISMRLMQERIYPAMDLDEHMAIIDTIDKRAPEAAREAMAAHIDSARENIVRKLGQI